MLKIFKKSKNDTGHISWTFTKENLIETPQYEVLYNKQDPSTIEITSDSIENSLAALRIFHKNKDLYDFSWNQAMEELISTNESFNESYKLLELTQDEELWKELQVEIEIFYQSDNELRTVLLEPTFMNSEGIFRCKVEISVHGFQNIPRLMNYFSTPRRLKEVEDLHFS